jgi:cytochrome bd-type quinol oxidase subunit 2
MGSILKKLIAKPHLFFFGLIPIFVLGAILSGNSVIDLNIHTIYFLMSIKHLGLLSAFFFLLIGANYFLLYWAQKPPQKGLTVLHVVLQILALIPFIYSFWYMNSDGQFIENTFFSIIDLNIALLISFLLFLISILIHIINLLISAFLTK